MFEREIKFIYDFNLNKVNRLGPYFTFEQLLSADLHPAILQYISAEIDYLVFEDRQNLLKNSVFDYSGEKISYHFNQISEEVKKSKRFALEYIAKLVMHASSFTVNYLVHPKWTLTKFVFDDENHKSTHEIKQILNYVYYYKYITKILISYINAKKILSMNAQEFEELLNKADKLGVESNPTGILSGSLKSMAEFFNIGEKIKTKIPFSAVEMFLEEKELNKHLTKMLEVFGSDENSRFNISDYEKVFNSVVIEKEALHEVQEEESEETITEEPIEPAEIEEPQVTEFEPTKEFETAEINEEQNLEEEQVQENGEEKIIEDNNISNADLNEEEVRSDKEIVITQPTKLRIRVDEEIKIEPIAEEEKTVQEELIFDEQKTEQADVEIPEEEVAEDEPIEENAEEDEFVDIDIPKLQLNAETTAEEKTAEEEFIDIGIPEFQSNTKTIHEDEEISTDKEMTEEEAEIEFQKELELAQKELEQKINDEPDKEEIIEETPQETNDEDESLSFMIKHKDDEPVEEKIEVNEEEKFIEPSLNEESEDEKPEMIFGEGVDKHENEINDASEKEIVNQEDEENEEEVKPIKMELAEILEHKGMTKIIDVIFDYDIEDFASVLDEISSCENIDEADQIIAQTLSDRNINRNSEEAESFRKIISEYFNRK